VRCRESIYEKTVCLPRLMCELAFEWFGFAVVAWVYREELDVWQNPLASMTVLPAWSDSVEVSEYGVWMRVCVGSEVCKDLVVGAPGVAATARRCFTRFGVEKIGRVQVC
jgi:hypothetical protein